MKGKAVIPLVLGLGMGFMAIKMGINMVKKAQGKPVETIKVVVAGRPIDAASRIDKPMLKLAEVPKALVPPGVFGDTEKLIGRVALMNIATGLPVSQEMLAPEGTEPGLPSQIPDGYRAISVRVDEATAVAGFVMPGHRVDIYALEGKSSAAANQKTRAVSRILLEDVQVAAVGQSIKTIDPDGKTTRLTRSVTVYVKPEDVPSLDVASHGRIRMVLRGSQEAGKGAAKGPSFGERLASMLKDMKAAQPAVVTPPPIVMSAPKLEEKVAPPPPPPHVVEINNGQRTQRIAFIDGYSSKRADGTAVNGVGHEPAPVSVRNLMTKERAK